MACIYSAGETERANNSTVCRTSANMRVKQVVMAFGVGHASGVQMHPQEMAGERVDEREADERHIIPQSERETDRFWRHGKQPGITSACRPYGESVELPYFVSRLRYALSSGEYRLLFSPLNRGCAPDLLPAPIFSSSDGRESAVAT